jgi:AcrR family transcriptional regulator
MSEQKLHSFMSGLLTIKKESKRTRILEAAKRRFGRFGIKATTVQDIARDADIAVGTIYQFFPEKDALVLAWVDEHRQLLHTQLEGVLRQPMDAEEKLREFLLVRYRTVEVIREEPAIAELTRAVVRLTPQSVSEMTHTVLHYLETILKEGRRTGCLPSAEPRKDAEILLLALAWFFTPEPDPVQAAPTEESMLRVVNWFISKWKLPRPKSRA